VWEDCILVSCQPCSALYNYPDIAASAPLKPYAYQEEPLAYYELATRTTEQASAGGSLTVRDPLEQDHATIISNDSFLDEARRINMCFGHRIPDYITSKEIFAEEVMMMVGGSFAGFNMENYHPTADTDLAKACFIFQYDSLALYGRIDKLLEVVIDVSNGVRRA
jgi:hypothetical protein